jgi:hypothetical protein
MKQKYAPLPKQTLFLVCNQLPCAEGWQHPQPLAALTMAVKHSHTQSELLSTDFGCNRWDEKS